jgi:hypothetical protein
MTHTPWQISLGFQDHLIHDSDGKVITDLHEINAADAERIVACVNACHGLPTVNGTISMVAYMKVAILNGDPVMLDIVKRRLVELENPCAPPPPTGGPEA